VEARKILKFPTISSSSSSKNKKKKTKRNETKKQPASRRANASERRGNFPVFFWSCLGDGGWITSTRRRRRRKPMSGDRECVVTAVSSDQSATTLTAASIDARLGDRSIGRSDPIRSVGRRFVCAYVRPRRRVDGRTTFGPHPNQRLIQRNASRERTDGRIRFVDGRDGVRRVCAG